MTLKRIYGEGTLFHFKVIFTRENCDVENMKKLGLPKGF
jgi:hypothetical protein